MPDDVPSTAPESQPRTDGAPTERAATPAADVNESTTPGGYAYSVVDDNGDDARAPMPASSQGSGRGMLVPLLLAALVPAIIVGVAVWFIASSRGGGSDNSRVSADVANLLNIFSQGSDGSVSTPFESQLAPGFPDGIPAYPGAKIVSSVRQTKGADVSYLVVYDANDSRDKVSAYFADKLKADPWQVDAGQDGRESTLAQFSKIDDPNITGLVLVSASNGGKLTTIVQNVQVTAGAADAPKTSFSPIGARSLPDKYPDGVPPYRDALLIESAFQKQGGAASYLASYITKDGASDVLDFYRGKFKDGGLTVRDGDATSSTLKDAQLVQFSTNAQDLTGQVTVGKFAQDEAYTRIDIQSRVAKAP